MTLDFLLKLAAEEYCFESKEWYQELVKSLPKNEWFEPTNKDKDVFTACNEMAYHNWISKKTEPIWSNGAHRGNRISFYISIEQ